MLACILLLELDAPEFRILGRLAYIRLSYYIHAVGTLPQFTSPVRAMRSSPSCYICIS